jgi:hypothetical protein
MPWPALLFNTREFSNLNWQRQFGCPEEGSVVARALQEIIRTQAEVTLRLTANRRVGLKDR